MAIDNSTAKRLTEAVDKIHAYLASAEDIASWDSEEIDHLLVDVQYLIDTNTSKPDEAGPDLVLEHIRDTVRAYFPNADYLTVGTDEWENGYFFSFGLVQVSIRGEDVVDTSKLADELRNWEGDLTDAYGPVGRGTRLLINLDTLEAELNP